MFSTSNFILNLVSVHENQLYHSFWRNSIVKKATIPMSFSDVFWTFIIIHRNCIKNYYKKSTFYICLSVFQWIFMWNIRSVVIGLCRLWKSVILEAIAMLLWSHFCTCAKICTALWANVSDQSDNLIWILTIAKHSMNVNNQFIKIIYAWHT